MYIHLKFVFWAVLLFLQHFEQKTLIIITLYIDFFLLFLHIFLYIHKVYEEIYVTFFVYDYMCKTFAKLLIKTKP